MTDEVRKNLLHPNDKRALDALRAIPAFTPILKGFLKVFSEQQLKIKNMSSKVRISPQQLPEIYNLLPPICEMLDIDEPELYLELNRNPNAYTFGDTVTSITLTTGLLECMSFDEISTVIAHECGHIACHHVLYHTMGSMIFSGLDVFLDFGGLLTTGFKTAFAYWSRCSEFSADRASALCAGGAKPVVDVMMRLAGGGRELPVNIDADLFMQQAVEYKEMINISSLNKTWEAFLLMDASHPLLSVRALEITRWCEEGGLKNILEGNTSIGVLTEREYQASKNRILYTEQDTDLTNGSFFSEKFNDISRAFRSGVAGRKKTCICPACGNSISSESVFCEKCGYKIR